MLRDNEVGDAAAVGIFVVIFFAVDEEDDVGVLLQGTGFTQMAELRALVLGLLNGTAELRKGDDRYVQFTREGFQRAGDL